MKWGLMLNLVSDQCLQALSLVQSSSEDVDNFPQNSIRIHRTATVSLFGKVSASTQMHHRDSLRGGRAGWGYFLHDLRD